MAAPIDRKAHITREKSFGFQKIRTLGAAAAIQISAIFAVFALTTFLLSALVVEYQLDKAESKEIANTLTRSSSNIYFMSRSIKEKVRDWGYWTEAYKYLQNGDEKFSRDFINAQLMNRWDVDAVAFVRYDKKLQNGYYFGRARNTIDPAVSNEWLNLASDPTLIDRMQGNRPLVSFAKIGQQLILFGASPIVRSDGSGTPEGFIMIGRQITDASLSEAVGAPVRFVAHPKSDRSYVKFYHDTINIGTPIRGIGNRSAGQLQYTLNRELKRTTLKIEQTIGWSILLMSLFLPFLIGRLINRQITVPIGEFRHELLHALETNTLRRVASGEHEFELGDLKQDFNRLMDNLEASRQEKRKAIAETESALAAAQKAERVKSDFLAMMSHEIRTPLTALLGNIEIITKIPSRSSVIKRIPSLLKSAKILNETVSNILNFSRMENGNILYDASPVRVNDLIQDIVESYQKIASDKGLKIKLLTDGDTSEAITDPMCIQQVVGNLVSNAIKFTEIGEIAVRVTNTKLPSSDKFRWRIEVADTGIGIASETIPELFRPFTQANFSTTRRFGGSGLGLSICKKIIEGMGGRIGLSSTLGQGSTFWCELDLSCPHDHSAQANTINAPTHDVPPMRILLVEDDPLVREILEIFLQSMGHDVSMADNGKHALEALQQGKFDIILMDMHMPEMGGIEALAEIKKRPDLYPAIPVIAMSADADPSRRHIYEDGGFQGFLTKPISQIALADALIAALHAKAQTSSDVS